MSMFRASVRLCAHLYKQRGFRAASVHLYDPERFVREVDPRFDSPEDRYVSLFLSRGPFSSSLSSTWGNDTRAGPPRDSYEASLSYSAPVMPPSSILFDYSVMGEKKASATGGGRDAREDGGNGDETKGRHEVGRYKWWGDLISIRRRIVRSSRGTAPPQRAGPGINEFARSLRGLQSAGAREHLSIYKLKKNHCLSPLSYQTKFVIARSHRRWRCARCYIRNITEINLNFSFKTSFCIL